MNNTLSKKDLISISLAVFSMLFGAGNLIYPLVVGRNSGNFLFFGMLGFIITAVVLPIAGLIAIILFDGDYTAFFHRAGTRVGSFLIFASLTILGPLIVIPRIVTLSHTMVAPFIPFHFFQEINIYSSFVFCLIFLGITFLATFRENKIVDILGKFVAPALLTSLLIIIGKGIITAQTTTVPSGSVFELFKKGFVTGYETIDLIAIIFFASIIITLLKQTIGRTISTHALALVGLQAGLIGATLLGLIYIGMGILGAFHGHGFETANSGELFRLLSFSVLGPQGAIIIAIAVLMACFSTSIALSAVFAEYVQHTLLRNKIGYVQALAITLLTCIPFSTIGLDYILSLTGGPITYVGYPILITLTFCNILYKLFGFPYVKIPVMATFFITLTSYIMLH